VVVRDLDFVCIIIIPAKAYAILLVNANAVLTSAISAQPFKAVARRNREFREGSNAVELVELTAGNRPHWFRARRARRTRVSPIENVLGSTIGERAYHGTDYNRLRDSSPMTGFCSHTLTTITEAKKSATKTTN
jgi:hypothetical protein